MPTITTKKQGGLPLSGQARVCVLRKTIDCGELNLAQNDILQVFSVAAGTYVLAVGLRVSTAEGGAGTVDVGYGESGGTEDDFLDGTDVNALTDTASLVSTGASVAVGGGAYFAAADTIDVKAMAALDTAVFELWAIVVNVGDPA